MSNKTKMKAIQTALSAIEKQFGKNAMMPLGQQKAVEIATIECGGPSLKRAMGCGGYPRIAD